MPQDTSGYDTMDLLNEAAEYGTQVEPPTQEATSTSSKTKLERIADSINSVLDKATNSVVTVDDIINGKADEVVEELTPAQKEQIMAKAQQSQFGAPNIGKLLLIGGLAVGGSVIAYKTLK